MRFVGLKEACFCFFKLLLAVDLEIRYLEVSVVKLRKLEVRKQILHFFTVIPLLVN